MNFFDHQQLARRNTRVMIVLYMLAVLGVIVAVDAVLAGVYLWTQSDTMLAARRAPLTRRERITHPRIWWPKALEPLEVRRLAERSRPKIGQHLDNGHHY